MIINPYLVSAAAGGGSPSDLTNLELWLKADAILGLNNNDPITTWNDSSGNGRNATAVQFSARKPIWKSTAGPNSKPCVEMISASTDGGYFTLPNFLTGFAAGDAFTVFQIDNDPPSSNNYAGPPLSNFGSTTDEYFVFTTDSKIYDGFGSTARKTTVDPATSLTAWGVYEERSATNDWSNYLNGTQLFTTATNTVGWGTGPTLGFTTTGSKLMMGRIAEVILYSRVLDNVTERQAVIYPYLNSKYGFTLS